MQRLTRPDVPYLLLFNRYGHGDGSKCQMTEKDSICMYSPFTDCMGVIRVPITPTPVDEPDDLLLDFDDVPINGGPGGTYEQRDFISNDGDLQIPTRTA
jgi:hypothetical protein